MTPEEKLALEKATADAAKAKADLETARADAATAKTEGERLAAKAREDAAQIATLKTENDLLKLQAQGRRSDADDTEAKKGAALAEERRVEEMIQLRSDARLVFATAEDPEGKRWSHVGKTPDTIRREVLTYLQPKLSLDRIDSIKDAGAKSESLRAVYDSAMFAKREQDKAAAEALAATQAAAHDDGFGGGDDDDDDAPKDAESARKAMVKKKKDAWKKKDKRPAA